MKRYSSYIGKLFGKNVCAKLRGWQRYKSGDVIRVTFDENKTHLFDRKTQNAIE